ncbi:hypothetical protein [Flavobacterium hydrophilum]|nr:hypothetical protein [Flavobacterium hydrophilum]
MKNSIFMGMLFVFICCFSTNTIIQKQSEHLSKTEREIINHFLNSELNSERYKSYSNFGITIIEEALKSQKSINSYEYTYNYLYESEKDKDYWVLNHIQIEKIKSKLEDEKQHYWEKENFDNSSIHLLKYDSLRQIIRTNKYIDLPSQLIIYLSKPLIINKNNALLSYDIGNSKLGFNPIIHTTVLMKKEKGKWYKSANFEDGTYN